MTETLSRADFHVHYTNETAKAIAFCQLLMKVPGNKNLIDQIHSGNKELAKELYEYYGNRDPYVDNPQLLEAKLLWNVLFKPPQGKGYIPILWKSQKFVDTVHKAGGVVLYSPESNFNKNTWDMLQNQGIDGIMAWHGGRLETDKGTVIDARRKGLLVLGGSDYHPEKNDWKIGEGNGDMFISSNRYSELMRYMEDKKGH
jgi:hypothetical protein